MGKSAEQAGIIHHGALVFSTIANLSVPHLCIVVRKYAESDLLDAVISEDLIRAEVERFLKSFHEKPLDRTVPRRVLCI